MSPENREFVQGLQMACVAAVAAIAVAAGTIGIGRMVIKPQAEAPASSGVILVANQN